MSLPDIQVLVEFEGFDPTYQPYFQLDSSEKGRLDNTEYPLAPADLLDVTPRVRSVNFGRGKSARFSSFQAGSLNVEFNNHDRAFDPLFTNSPFFGEIVPRRKILILSAGITVFTGFIEDWDLSYDPSGDSIAQAKCFDGLYILAGQRLSTFTPTQQKTGERIEAILDRSEVAWSATDRDIDTGAEDVGTQVVTANANALNYLQKVNETEPGLLFVSGDGVLTFRDKYKSSGTAITEFSNDEIPFSSLEVIYGSELLYNEIVVSNEGGGTAIATDELSADQYGVRAVTLTGLLGATDTQSENLAGYYLGKFKEPSYRFESLEVLLHSLTPTEQEEVLALELGDVATVKFTPNNIGDPIERTVEIIRIDHNIQVDSYFVNFGFQELKNEFLILDDQVFGKLDEGILA